MTTSVVMLRLLKLDYEHRLALSYAKALGAGARTRRCMISSDTTKRKPFDRRNDSKGNGGEKSKLIGKANFWIPRAYRVSEFTPGSEKFTGTNFRSGIPFLRGKNLNKSRLAPRQDPGTLPTAHKAEWIKNQAKKSEEARELSIMQDQAERIISIPRHLFRFVKDYRAVFSSSVPEQKGLTSTDLTTKIGIKYEDETERKKALLRSIIHRIRNEFIKSDLHNADTLVDFAKIENTENLYRSMCRLLQGIIKVSSKLASFHQYKNFNEFVDLAELALRSLAKLTSDRAILVEATRQWSDKNLSKYTPRNENFLLGNLRKILDALLVTDVERKIPDNLGSLASHDPSLGVTPEHFAIVMTGISDLAFNETSRNVNREAGHATSTSTRVDFDRKVAERASKRMISLLNIMPSTTSPHPEALKQVLEMLCRVGNLESARLCLDTFRRYPSKQYRLRFSLVLHAYLEAVKHEKSDKKQLSAAKEALIALNDYWETGLSTHRVERIGQCSIVLNSFCIANERQKLPDLVIQSASRLVMRSLGKRVYEALMADIISGSQIADAQVLPLMNYLSQLYALSTNEERKLEAKHMLSYIIKCDIVAESFISLPLVSTCNAIFKGMLQAYDEQHTSDDAEQNNSEKKAKVTTDLDFNSEIINRMIRSRNVGCRPNDETFTLSFDLLMAARPDDIGERAEALLSKMQVIESRSPGSVSLSLSSYQRVLRCLLEAASYVSTKRAARRALKIVDSLELQSTPFFMTDKELKSLSTRALYDLNLRPTNSTYQLLLQICNATTNEEDFESAAEVAVEVYRRIIASSTTSEKRAMKYLSLVENCINRLDEKSPKRKMLLRSLSEDSGSLQETADSHVAEQKLFA